ncbi:MAG: hypothetical protein ACOYM3_33045, partial [Terrimicrobiaceae bacterium]
YALPLPKMNATEIAKLSQLGRQLFHDKNKDSALKSINETVYKCYNLTPLEIEVIESSAK